MSAYAATVRPVLDPPHPSSLPRAEQLELSGANAWAYGVSTRLLADPGRWDLFNLVQGGMEWLDEYWGEIEDKYVDNTNTEEEMYASSNDHVIQPDELVYPVTLLTLSRLQQSSRALTRLQRRRLPTPKNWRESMRYTLLKSIRYVE